LTGKSAAPIVRQDAPPPAGAVPVAARIWLWVAAHRGGVAVDFDWPAELVAFRDAVRTFAKVNGTPMRAQEMEEGPASPNSPARRNIAELERRGWLRISWPESLGGQAKSPWYQFLLALELGYHDVEYNRGGTASMIGPAIQKFGTEEQKAYYVPRIYSGEIVCALGYSEPNAGSDLASLQTRAVRDGDEYVINGSKIWTSNAQNATHIWLAVRTDPTAPKHRGISIFIVDKTTPGITIRPIWVLSGHHTNEVFYDDVRIPANTLIGEENRGWYIMANALDHERITIGVNNYIDLVQAWEWSMRYLQKEHPEILADPFARAKLTDLKLDLHVLRALLMQCSAIIANGGVPTKEASMGKVWATDLRQRLTGTIMDLLGRRGVQEAGSPEEGPVSGRVEQMFRRSVQSRFTGGANELQKTIIAERGLGLPRGG
jgi:alkylation response protein AidB-like acyl-CoA dehydrogenase